MHRHLKQILLHVVVFSAVWALGCGDSSDPTDPADKLCRGESGFAAQITGTPAPVEMCVSDENTFTTYIPSSGGDKYNSIATYEIDGLIIEVEMSFFVQDQTPVTLIGTSNRAQAESDPGSLLFVYHESKPGTYDYESVTANGVFTVAFSDMSVAVVTFGGLKVDLEDVSTNDPAGSRAISEGYLSVTPD